MRLASRLAAACLPIALLVAGVTCAPGPGPKDKKSAENDTKKDPETKAPDLLEKRLEHVVANVRQRDLLTTHAFWTIFHGILGMGPDITLLDADTGKRVPALDRIAAGDAIRGLEFVETPHGLDVVTMAGSGTGQGHQDQFIAEMVQWDVSLDRTFKLNGKERRFEEFVKHSKMRASTTRDQELSWAIVIVSTHFGTDHRWKNLYNENISLEDVVRYEAAQPIKTAACGGTHRLFGLTWALHLHKKAGGKIVGAWKDAEARVAEYVANAKKWQNADGSFSSDYVSGEGFTRDPSRRIGTTGHVFEWLALALPPDELKKPWMEKAAGALGTMILEHQSSAIDGGSLYHAMHGLHIYRQRVHNVPGPRGLLVPLPPEFKN